MKLDFFSGAFAAITLLSSTVLASILKPAVLPLFVRNPYLSAWLADARSPPWSTWPMFWTGQQIGLGAMLHVPKYKTVYPLVGVLQAALDSHNRDYTVTYPIYHGPSFDGSATNLTYTIIPAGSGEYINVTISFLSPVTVNDTMRQSIPAGYMSVEVEGNVDASLYVDVNGLWCSGDRGSSIEWFYTETKELKTFQVNRRQEAGFTEFWERAEWGKFYFSAGKDVHHEVGTSTPLRQRFAAKGLLDGTIDRNFRTIMDDEPVFAFSKQFNLAAKHYGSTTGSDKPNKDSALFTLAHVQDSVIQFAAARGHTELRPLWSSYFATARELLQFHYNDYQKVAQIASLLTAQILSDATKGLTKKQGEIHTDILLLSARQVLGGCIFAGTPTEPLIFMKEISSDGNTQTIDVIFPAFPFFLYSNPEWLRYLLEPLLEHQAAGLYPNKYSMHDLGASFPNATGHDDGRDEYMPVEECGNMLIMGAAVVGNLLDTQGQKAAKAWVEGAWGEGGGVKSRYGLWKQWTTYLIEFGLYPATQLSTDDFAGQLANQTNLALKGIIGIKAMSQIAAVVGRHDDEKYYEEIAERYVKHWEEIAVSRDGTHTKLAYHWYGSWGTLYNLYADSLLCYRSDQPSNSLSAFSTTTSSNSTKKSFVPDRIYDIQSKWYNNVIQSYGLPLDSRHIYTKSDWELFAASVASPEVRGLITETVGSWVSDTTTDRPMTDLYDAETGGWCGINFMARPVVGGHFAGVALGKQCGGKGLWSGEREKDVMMGEGPNSRAGEKVGEDGGRQIVLGTRNEV